MVQSFHICYSEYVFNMSLEKNQIYLLQLPCIDCIYHYWQERISHIVVALYGWPEQTIPLSVSAQNQTKDFWTWNLAVSGSGKGRRKRVGWTKELAGVDDGTRTRAVGDWTENRVGVEPWIGAVNTDSGDSSREKRVQPRWRRSTQDVCIQVACGIFASNSR